MLLLEDPRMGNNQNKQERVVPDNGYRVINILKPSIAAQLDLLTDYILSPDPRKIDLKREQIKFQVYSILSEDIRTVELPIINKELGIQLKIDTINPCIFRVTKIFPGSPLEKHGVHLNEFIVGMLEGNYTCIKSFAEVVTSTTIHAPKSSITLGICDASGKTRMIKISVQDIKVWQLQGKGLLGCELGEGWIHKWKPILRKTESDTSVREPSKIVRNDIQIPKMKQIEEQDGQQQLDSEVDRRCDALERLVNGGDEIQVKFKGILKNEEAEDASGICKCRPRNPECEMCFEQKDGNYYFYNKKTHSVMAIPMKLMLVASE